MPARFPPPAPLNKPSQPSSAAAAAHPSLPARPTAPLPSFKPAFKPASSSSSAAPAGSRGGFGSALAFKPPSVAAKAPSVSWQQTYTPTVSAGPAPPSSISNNTSTQYPSNGPTQYPNQGGYGQGQAQYYQQPQVNNYSQPVAERYPQPGAGPQLQNPFPAPGTVSGRPDNYDPELEAQIAQWQSAYMMKEDGSRPIIARPVENLSLAKDVSAPSSGVAAVVSGADGKQKTVVRSGGGKTWQDASLLEWDPSHPRLFIGNLAGEVTDDSLLKAFARYPSVQRARVIRDKRTAKSKGYGFVSFTNSDDYFQAAKEMQGKYIGSHPVLIKRSTTEIKAVAPQPKGKKGNSGGGSTRAGVQKKLPKKKGGLRILG